MRKALRGYAKDKDGNLILIGTMPVPFSKDKCAPAVRQQKDIWLGKVERSLGKKRFVNRPLDRPPEKSRRRIGRLRQFQRRARAARSRLESRGYAYGPKNQVAPGAPSPRCAREVRRCPRSSNPSN